MRRNSHQMLVKRAKGPTEEIGAPANVGAGVPPWGSMYLGDDLELVPELQWPESVITYHAMRNDAQLEGLYMGTTLPIRNYNWCIDRNGCDATMTELLAKDMGLPLKGQDKQSDRQQRRTKGRFSHDKHLSHAMLTLVYGHYFFEQVGVIGPDDEYWHLKKAAPRPPATIMKLEVDEKGGLASIQQNISTQIGQMAKPIPVDRLIAYVWDQEGANWFGRSMFRSCFRNYLIKDRLLRVDALKHQRNGMGLPVGIGSQGGGPEELKEIQAITSQVKAGEQSSVALPYGTSMSLEGVRGTLPDTIASVRFHNEEMARRFLMMFMQLGESLHGNRALGDSFIEFFQLNQDTVAKWYATTTTEHLIEDWWDWNVGPDADATPKLTYERDDDPRFAFGELAQLITAGLIEVDDELEEAVRQAMDLPRKDASSIRVPALPDPAEDPNNPDPAAEPTSTVKAAKRQGRSIRAGAPASPALSLPDRALRRQPAEYEMSAQVDFDLMDKTYSGKLDALFAQWKEQVIPAQLDELEAAILKTAKLETLAAIEAPALGRDLLHGVMLEMYNSGVSAAIAEAHSQDVFVETPEAEDHIANLLPRAAAVDEVNARMLGQMAGSRALRLSGEASTKAEVAAGTKSYLADLKHVMVKDRLGGALQAAYNTGRFAVYKEAPAGEYYASELLDNNTCAPCTDVDGTRYSSLLAAERDYVGGYIACQGGDRCRGTVVAVYGEA